MKKEEYKKKNNKKYHVNLVEDKDEEEEEEWPQIKKEKEEDAKEYVLFSVLSGPVTHEEDTWLIDGGASIRGNFNSKLAS